MIVAFEGIDRVGKTTQADLARAAGFPVFRFPDRSTPVGAVLDRYLRKEIELPDAAVHYLFLANTHEILPRIRAAVAAGKIVIVDRYAATGVVYGIDRDYPERRLRYDWAGVPPPDLTLLFDLDPVVAAGRVEPGKAERYDKVELQTKLRARFLAWPGITRIDASKSVEEVASAVRDAVAYAWADKEGARVESAAARAASTPDAVVVESDDPFGERGPIRSRVGIERGRGGQTTLVFRKS